MDKKCGMIIHPEDFDDLLSMEPKEAGIITQNAIKTFLGNDDLVPFDDRFLRRVSRDVCSRVERDRQTYINKAAAGRKGGLASAESKQKSSKKQAKVKQSSSKNEADSEQTGKQSSSPIPKPIPIPISNNTISIVEEIVDYLNKQTGKHYQAKGETAKYINGRLKDGYTFDDFKKVIDKKTRKWKNDPKMYEFLRPSTLFAPSHFDEYLNEPEEAPKGSSSIDKYTSGNNSLNPFNRFTQRPDSEFDYDSYIKN